MYHIKASSRTRLARLDLHRTDTSLARGFHSQARNVDTPRLESTQSSLPVISTLVGQDRDGRLEIGFILILFRLPLWVECQVVIGRDGQDLVDRSCAVEENVRI